MPETNSSSSLMADILALVQPTQPLTELEKEQALAEEAERQQQIKEKEAIRRRARKVELNKNKNSRSRKRKHSDRSERSGQDEDEDDESEDDSEIDSQEDDDNDAEEDEEDDDDDDDDDKQEEGAWGESTRSRLTKQKKSAALESLKHNRATKKQNTNFSGYSSESDEEELSHNKDAALQPYRSSMKITASVQKPLTYEEILDMQILRRDIAQWCHAPFFADFVENMYVRYRLDKADQSGQPVYRLCKVDGAVMNSSKGYKLEQDGIMTTHKLELNHAGATKTFGMQMISNASITQKEYQRWYDTCKAAERKGMHGLLPSNRDVEETRSRLIRQRNHINTASELNAIVESKKRLNPANHKPASLRISLEQQLQEAEGDPSREGDVIRLTLALKALDDKAAELVSNRMEKNQWIAVNERNRKFNLERGAAAEREERASMKTTTGESDISKRVKVAPRMFVTVTNGNMNSSGPLTPAAIAEIAMTSRPTSKESFSEYQGLDVDDDEDIHLFMDLVDDTLSDIEKEL